MTVQQVWQVRVRTVLVLLAIAVSRNAAALPSGFTQTVLAGGLSNPTAMQFAPDGRLFVCQQGGQLRVIKNGVLLSTPFTTLTVNSSGERGLLGVAFDPAFASNHFVYVYYTATTPAIHNRISRFTANGDVAVAGSEVPIFDLDNLSGATNHNGGAINFGPDGKLYAAVGENANGANAQSMTTVLGKMLRINSDGTIPTDNPFFATTTGNNRAIWALGLRNPFTFAFNPVGTELFINDVGENTWEEINNGIAGANYGWPTTEGATTDPRFVSPLYTYNHSGGECAITGGAFYAPPTTQFPSDYVRDYFFSDFCGGWIRKLDTASGAILNFASGLSSPVDLKVGDDGSLYVLARGAGSVYRIQYAPSDPVITSHPSSQTVAAGSPVTFSVRASSTTPLRYQWQRNGTDISGATAADYTISSTTAADNGARFRANVTNDFSSVLSNEAVLTVTGGTTGATLLTTQTPAAENLSDGHAWELGVRVISDVAGQITALRFWKGSSETSPHTGHVWTAAGQLLATVTFTNESASGWQEQPLGTPVAMAANAEYIVSVTTPPNNFFVVTHGAFTTPLVNGHLRAVAGANGVFGPVGMVPNQSYDSSNYFRDLVFVAGGGGGGDTVPPTVSITQPMTGNTVSGMVTITATSGDNVGVAGLQFQVDGANIGNEILSPPSPASITWDSTTVANGSRVLKAVVRDAAGNSTPASITVTVSNAAGSSQRLLTTQTPAAENLSDGHAWELGVRVISDVAGQITALRFWKGSSETSPHTGHVWTAAGQLLATVTFTNESASGWQEQPLGTPVAMAANAEYIVSVTTPPNNFFVVTHGAFTTPLVNGHLRAVAGANGVFGPVGMVPNQSYDSSNYFRDLVFVAGGGGGGDTVPPTVSITQPMTGNTVSGMVTITATSGDNVGVAGLQFQVDGANIGNEILSPPSPASITWDSTTVANGSRVLKAVVRDAAGNSTPASITVTVSNAAGSSQRLLTTQTPAAQNLSDGRPWELGVRVISDVAGQITALRFWKGSSENNPHTGHVWTAAGQLLATVTFTNETASGWQEQLLASPVAVVANAEYIVSVTTPPNNFFVVTHGAFTTPLVNGHLRAVAGANGVFGPVGVFPTQSYDSSNYFRDLVFVPGSGGGSSAAFPVKVGTDVRHLVDQNNVPFLVNGDAAWSLMVGLQKPEASVYLADRSAKGFNTVLVELVEHHFSIDPPKNAYGDGPFTTPGDFSTPNEAYFAHADWVINEAAARGMLVLLTPAYLGYNCGGEGWCQEMNANGVTKMFNYGVYVGNRYKNFKNILWVEGGDTNANAYAGTGDIMRAVINGIKSVDGPRVHTGHCNRETSALDCYDEPWLDVNTTYSACARSALRTQTDYNRARVMPFFYIEGTYENEGASDVCLRSQAYWSILGGSSGHVFGNNPIWPFTGPAWQGALNSTGAQSMANVGALFRSRAWQTLVPDYLHQVVTAGYGNVNDATYVAAARASDGSMAIAYLPGGGTITVDMSRLSNSANARWYDPAAGTFTSIAGSPFANTGLRNFTTPGTNAGGSVDWVLVLEIAGS